jgi:predicted acylesterase/phospholipase RssA
MRKIGLALSGGGFRASIYHLGLIRFLRDAGLLSRVSHITSVSGGSIFGAHLALNWNRYNGSPSDFDAVAAEFLAFVDLDIRNRIVRRYPFTLPVRLGRRLVGLSNRKLTRTGLLEAHYERYLYGDRSLFELPESPSLHLLATNLKEGCLCSFNRAGLWMVRRQAGGTLHIERLQAGLATVAMAVAASSAFPGFFPPLVLTNADIGTGGEFGHQAFTDGGVFDNLGVRMFRSLERPLLLEAPLAADDIVDLKGLLEALRQASEASGETPLGRFVEILAHSSHRTEHGSGQLGNSTPVARFLARTAQPGGDQTFVAEFGELLRSYQFQHEPLFARLARGNSEVEILIQASMAGNHVLSGGDQLWLNRYLLESAVRHVTGQPCFRGLGSGVDGVLVSDVGKAIEIQADQRSGGFFRTALRSTDILMDRVWQLELETFQDTPGYVFAPVTQVVDPHQDPTALHPEIQRQVANIRTDLDRFSPLEISTLVRHGYCIGRQACRSHPELFGTNLPADPPWEPPQPERSSTTSPVEAHPPARPAQATDTATARKLQPSAFRRIWTTLWDSRDWVSYIYIPILVPLVLLLPYYIYRQVERAYRLNALVASLSQGTRDLEKMYELMGNNSPRWKGEPSEEVQKLDEPTTQGFEILQESLILDLRPWKIRKGYDDPASWGFIYRRTKVAKLHDNTTNNLFHLNLLPVSPKAEFRFPSQQLDRPRLRMAPEVKTGTTAERVHWQVSYDFQLVPAGDMVDLLVETHFPGGDLDRGESHSALAIPVHINTAELTSWILMPQGKDYRSWGIIRYKTGKPENVEPVKVVTEYLAQDYAILAFKLLSLEAGYTYEVRWDY